MSEKNLQFNITKEALVDLVEKYFRKEDIEFIERNGGDHMILKSLGVNSERGIETSEVEKRQEKYGSNQEIESPPKSFFWIFCDTAKDMTLQVVVIVSIIYMVSHIAMEKSHRDVVLIEGFGIILTVMLVIIGFALVDYYKEKQFRKLSRFDKSHKIVFVWRDNLLTIIRPSRLVVGDIVKVTEGMVLDADMMLLEGHDVVTNEETLTGEPDLIKKKPYIECLDSRNEMVMKGMTCQIGSPILLADSKVVSGEGKAVVIAVGPLTYIGKALGLFQQEHDSTPLQNKLDTIAQDVGTYGLAAAAIIFIVLLVRFFVDRVSTGTLGEFSKYTQIIQFFIFAVTIVVVAIPENLPLLVTWYLAFSMRNIARDKILLKNFSALEKMGCVQDLICHKTGILTSKEMELVLMWSGGRFQTTAPITFPKRSHDLIKQAFACNTKETFKPTLNSTDTALLNYLARSGEDYDKIRAQYINKNSISYPFSTGRKRMSTIIDVTEDDSSAKRRIHTKGAPEIILSCCNKFYDLNQDREVSLTPELKNRIEQEIESIASRGLRTLCIAYKDLTQEEDVFTRNNPTSFGIEKENFTLIGVLGIQNFGRSEVPESISLCRKSGITVKMVTGDHQATTKAIARQLQLINSNDQNSMMGSYQASRDPIESLIQSENFNDENSLMTGSDFRKKVGGINNVIQSLNVLARSEPRDVNGLVVGLKERNEVVALVSKSVDDIPSLGKVDVGITFDSATDIVKQRAGIIILDDHLSSAIQLVGWGRTPHDKIGRATFDSPLDPTSESFNVIKLDYDIKPILKSVVWGRNLYDNIRKVVQFQLTIIVTVIVITIFGSLVLNNTILQAAQLLWISMTTELLAIFALITEEPTAQTMQRKPYDLNDNIISPTMKKHIFGQAAYQLIVIFLLIFTESSGHYTIVFNTLVFLQIFNVINCRILQDIGENKYFLRAISLVTLIQIFIINFGSAFSLHSLDIGQWFTSIFLASGSLIWSLLLRKLEFKSVEHLETSKKNTEKHPKEE